MKEIGGYFELELPASNTKFLHSNCVAVNSGRHALEYILRGLADNIKSIYLPYYTCEVVLQPIIKLGIPYKFYHIDLNLELKELPELKDGEYIILNNYFGIKDTYIEKIADIYGEKAIIDNAQAWYAKESKHSPSFYSPRKFFGLPDGGYAGANHRLTEQLEQDASFDRCSHLLKRIDLTASKGYDDFKSNSNQLQETPLKRMSKLTERILQGIDMESVMKRRKENFKILNNALHESNLLPLPSIDSFECPMIYPYLTNDIALRTKLIHNKIFVATYWPNVFNWCMENEIEYRLAKNLISLPIDQRYNNKDMHRIIQLINDFNNERENSRFRC